MKILGAPYPFLDLEVYSLRLTIADVRLLLSAPLPFEFPPFTREYKTFCDASLDWPNPDLCVQLVMGIPDSSQWGKLLTVAAPWRLFRAGDVRRLVWDGNNPQDPLWLAEFVPDSRTVVVYCGARLTIEADGAKLIRNPLHYPLDQLIMLYTLTRLGKGIVHSAGLVLGGRCIVAAGRSGAGKSTLSRCWAARHGIGTLLSDDRVILGCSLEEGAGTEAYGSPWPGEMGVALNERKPLGALVFLSKAKENRLVPISSREAVERLFPVTSIPWFDPEYMVTSLANVERWVAGIPVYEFQFTPDEKAVKTLETLFPFSGGTVSGGATRPT